MNLGSPNFLELAYLLTRVKRSKQCELFLISAKINTESRLLYTCLRICFTKIPCLGANGIQNKYVYLQCLAKTRAIRACTWKQLVSKNIQGLDASESGDLEGCKLITWTNCPYLNRWADDRQLKLNANWADNVNHNWSAPSFRDYLGKDFNQPPSILPISLRRDSKCW